MAKRPYDVGYAKPPAEHQFKAGNSGNPRGRPKGARGFKNLVEEALSAKVTLNEKGQRRQVSVAAATLKRLIQKAVVDGDQRAIDRVLNLAQLIEADRPAPIVQLDDNDRSVLEAFVRRAAGDKQ